MWVAIGISVAASGYQAYQSDRADDRARDEMNRQREDAERLATEARERMEREESDATAAEAQKKARERQRQLARGAQGRRSTILTGPRGIADDPLGVLGDTSSGGKQLLGL